MHEFYFGKAPTTTDVLPEDEVTIAGRASTFPDNFGVGGATVEVYEVDADTGQRIDQAPVESTVLPADGSWGPFDVDPEAHYEFELTRDDSDIVHHFYPQPFERTNHFVRLQTSNPGEGAALLIEDGPDHTALVITRNREWWGDQGEGSDALEVDGVDIVNEGTSPRSDRNIAVFAFDAESDGESNPTTKLFPFTLPQTTFLTGTDLYIPADEDASGTVEVANSPRGSDRTEVLNVPNWPSDEHRVSVIFRDYLSVADELEEKEPPPFKDLDGNVHKDNIRTLQLRGIILGLDEERFGPKLHLKRDQMASILARALDLEPVDSGPFTDISGNVHEGAINALAAEGIALGRTEGSYSPRADIRRDQLSAMIGRALEIDEVASGPFTDVAGNTHEGWINALADADIVLGYADGTFRPGRNVQRDQAASMVARALPLFDARD